MAENNGTKSPFKTTYSAYQVDEKLAWLKKYPEELGAGHAEIEVTKAALSAAQDQEELAETTLAGTAAADVAQAATKNGAPNNDTVRKARLAELKRTDPVYLEAVRTRQAAEMAHREAVNKLARLDATYKAISTSLATINIILAHVSHLSQVAASIPTGK